MADAPEEDPVRLRARIAELERQLERLAEAEEQAMGARAQAQALLDNIPHLAWMKDTEGVFLAVNEPFARAAGHTKAEILGKTDHDLWPRELADRYKSDDQRVMASGQKVHVEEPIAQASGTQWFETFKTPIRDSRGHVIGTVGLARDITERKRAEEERRALDRRTQQTQKLESLGVLAGGIAHDFNNLLVGVLANAELALSALERNDGPAEVWQRVADIRNAALHAAELTKQMLAYSGKGRFDVRPISLSAVVQEMSQLLLASISKKARIVYELTRDLPAVRADVTQMHQLVMNLITNASEALEDRAGSIRVRTGLQVVEDAIPDLYGPTLLPPGRYVYLEVADDGCGMDEQTRSRLFEPFFTTKTTGRGLGLAAVQGIVRGHRGGIVLHSAVGSGTTVRILLPCTEEPAVVLPSPAREVEPEWTGQGLVMLVDDDARVREVTGLLLRSIGFEVLALASGREALAEFERCAERVRLVLLDVTMPDLDGEQVLRELRRIRPNVPVILCSGYSEQEIGCRFSADDMATFLQKPFPFEVLRERVRELLER